MIPPLFNRTKISVRVFKYHALTEVRAKHLCGEITRALGKYFLDRTIVSFTSLEKQFFVKKYSVFH